MKSPQSQRPSSWAMRQACVLACVASLSPTLLAQVTTINFEDLSSGQLAGNAVPGLTITTCDIPDTVAVGDVISPTNAADGFWLVADPTAAVSPPNYIIPRDEVALDLLISFETPVTRVKLYADRFAGEPHNLLRLLAVRATGTVGMYEVLEVTEAWDELLEQVENNDPPGNWMAVSGGGTPFTSVVFQALTELEGIDDLTFTPEGTPTDPNDTASTGIPPTPPPDSTPTDSSPGDSTPTADAGAPVNATPTVAPGPCPAVSTAMFSGLMMGLWLTCGWAGRHRNSEHRIENTK